MKLRPGRLSHSPKVKGKCQPAPSTLPLWMERVKLGSSHAHQRLTLSTPSLAASSSLEAPGGKTIVVLARGLPEGPRAPSSMSHRCQAALTERPGKGLGRGWGWASDGALAQDSEGVLGSPRRRGMGRWSLGLPGRDCSWPVHTPSLQGTDHPDGHQPVPLATGIQMECLWSTYYVPAGPVLGMVLGGRPHP